MQCVVLSICKGLCSTNALSSLVIWDWESAFDLHRTCCISTGVGIASMCGFWIFHGMIGMWTMGSSGAGKQEGDVQ